jgi:ribosome-associated protein YbcJ (S4-like RNA binding protein)
MLNSRRNRTFKIEQDWSLLNRNIYLYKRKIGKKRSTYGRKKALNDRLLKFDGVLSDVVYSSGFSNSSRSSKHLILEGKIEVNGLVVKVPSLKLKSGDVVTCTDSKSLLWYYIQR